MCSVSGVVDVGCCESVIVREESPSSSMASNFENWRDWIYYEPKWNEWIRNVNGGEFNLNQVRENIG